ncbi:hypothetical protein [Lewinella sp. W8]|uniref:hypothetical protein n=1 Tax=Lewinella sp. W8 TaxID=2528208 RepID=UPI00106854C3|nr:hypothetical protein [Lewinella sp. W8]MTB53904.1 hypothetical protein [Lewinella sp. W8]
MEENNYRWVYEVKEMVAEGNTKIAIEKLLNETRSKEYLRDIFHQTSIISNRFQELVKKESLGTLPVYDNTRNVILNDLIELLSEVESNMSKNNDEFNSPRIGLFQKLFMAKNKEEIEKLKFESESEKRKRPNDFQAHQLHRLISESYEYEKWKEKPTYRNNSKLKRKVHTRHHYSPIGPPRSILGNIVKIILYGLLIWGAYELIQSILH